ncbi:MAG: mCpol domain-containing protein [Candidatus Magasanikbacteria bacterium]|nr:mCpol domain-containing protein [Candidatus Magasanikbacteria bacterium]
MRADMLYLAFDGDNVGSQLSQLIELGEDRELAAYAAGVQEEMFETARAAERIGATVLMCSGDSLLFRLEHKSQAERILYTFRHRKKRFVTHSVGVGRTVQEAHKKLMHAKLAGKNRVCWYYEPAPLGRLVIESLLHPLVALKNFHFKGFFLWK